MQRINWVDRWPHFSVEEILSAEQLTLYMTRGVFPYSFRALDKLEQFRVDLGEPLIINGSHGGRRGARSIADVIAVNKEVRGVSPHAYSFHLWCAFDVSSPKLSPREIQQFALKWKSKYGGWGGIGLYDTWVHLDDRDSISGAVALWDYRKSRE